MCKFCSKQGPFVHCSLCLTDSQCSFCSKCSCKETKCKLHKCCNSCTFCVLSGPPQKKGVSPNVSSENGQIKPVKDVFSVDLSPSALHVTNVLSVVEGLPVGARLQKFWQVWAQKGSSPRVVSILKEGYNLPFTRIPLMEQICQSPQEQLPAGGIAFPPSKTSYRKGKGTNLSSLLQQTFHCSKTK